MILDDSELDVTRHRLELVASLGRAARYRDDGDLRGWKKEERIQARIRSAIRRLEAAARRRAQRSGE